MLINLSNHPFDSWDEQHKSEAFRIFGSVTDIAFPEVDPNASTGEVVILANMFLNDCMAKLLHSTDVTNAVHISGEPSFLFWFVTLAKSKEIVCVCSTTKRIVTNHENVKKSVFHFVKFRSY